MGESSPALGPGNSHNKLESITLTARASNSQGLFSQMGFVLGD
jgi:hypothetical protein